MGSGDKSFGSVLSLPNTTDARQGVWVGDVVVGAFVGATVVSTSVGAAVGAAVGADVGADVEGDAVGDAVARGSAGVIVVGDCTGSDAVGLSDGTRTAAADSSRVADSENAMGDAVGDVAGVVEDTVRRSTRLATKTNNTPVNAPTVARLEIRFIVLGCDVCMYVYNCEEEHSTCGRMCRHYCLPGIMDADTNVGMGY